MLRRVLMLELLMITFLLGSLDLDRVEHLVDHGRLVLPLAESECVQSVFRNETLLRF